MKDDLEKMDANVAEMYAAKCKKKPEDLLALMKKGGWLTAKEALEWGFVDEITEYEDDEAPIITDLVAADMSAAGIPVPTGISKEQTSNNVMARFIESLTNFFKSNQNSKSQMTTDTNQPQAQQNEAPATEVQQTEAITAEDHNNAIAAKDAEIANLKAEIEAMKKAPGDSTSHVVDSKPSQSEQKNEDPSSPEAFFATRKRAQELYDNIPH